MTRKKVLVVDDEEAICEVMKETLDRGGYDVAIAKNGVEGLQRLSEENFDVVILDLNMPRMDGYVFMEHLTQRWGKEKTGIPFPKIIVLTAVSIKKDLGLAKNLGAALYLNKPFKGKDLLKTVKKILD